MPVFSRIFPNILHCCLCIWYFYCLKHKHKVVFLRPFHAVPHRIISYNNARVFFVLCSSTVRQIFPVRLTLPTFYAHCMISLNSSSSGSMKWILRNLRALSSFGFSMFHFCLSLRFDASDISFHISGNKVSDLEVDCFLVRLLLDHVYPSGGFPPNTVKLVKPVHVSDNSRSPSTFQ